VRPWIRPQMIAAAKYRYSRVCGRHRDLTGRRWRHRNAAACRRERVFGNRECDHTLDHFARVEQDDLDLVAGSSNRGHVRGDDPPAGRDSRIAVFEIGSENRLAFLDFYCCHSVGVDLIQQTGGDSADLGVDRREVISSRYRLDGKWMVD